MTYSGMACSHTTIGAGRFHFRVRNGIGWFPLAMAARQNRKTLCSTLVAFANAQGPASFRESARCITLSAEDALRLYGQVSRAISTG